MTKIKIKNTINLELREGDEFVISGKSAEDYINRLSNFPHYVEVVASEEIESHTEQPESLHTDETVEDDAVSPVEEKVVETVDYEAMTIPELKAELTEKGIEFDSHAKKAELVELISQAGE